jgi:hypothetical protein
MFYGDKQYNHRYILKNAKEVGFDLTSSGCQQWLFIKCLSHISTSAHCLRTVLTTKKADELA